MFHARQQAVILRGLADTGATLSNWTFSEWNKFSCVLVYSMLLEQLNSGKTNGLDSRVFLIVDAHS